MGGLLNQAKRFFSGKGAVPASRTQRFSVACAQGHRLSGVRTEGYQALRCQVCGEGIFVLPRSPLPEPMDERSGARAEPAAHGATAWPQADDDPIALRDPTPEPPEEIAEADGEIIWDDEAPAEPMRPVGPAPEDLAAEEMAERSAAPAPAAKPKPRPKPRSQPRPEPARVVEVEPRASFGERLSRWRNPLIFASVLGIVAATAAFRSWRAWRADLPRVVERGRTEGLEALDDGKYVPAHQILSEAKRAVEALGGAVEGAAAVVQGADEAAVLVRLVKTPLESMLDEAVKASDPKAWERTFHTNYEGQTIVVDDFIRAAPDARHLDGAYELEFEILPMSEGGKPATRGRIDLSGFKLFELTKPRVGDHVTFGARLKSFRYDLSKDVWLVGLEPDSGVLMTHAKALEPLGIQADSGEEDRP